MEFGLGPWYLPFAVAAVVAAELVAVVHQVSPSAFQNEQAFPIAFVAVAAVVAFSSAVVVAYPLQYQSVTH